MTISCRIICSIILQAFTIMGQISNNLFHIHQAIDDCANKYQRSPQSVTLLCVSKTKPIASILEAYQSGERHFGESYAHEADSKIQELKDKGYNDIVWHFIGPIQSNKTKIIATYFDIVESVDRIKIAERLNDQRPSELKPLEVLIQVNISDEEQKSGCSFAQLPELIAFIKQKKRLHLRGLMGIAKETDDQAEIECSFIALKKEFDKYHAQYPDFDILSMGMTHDMEAAIKCGTTEVRIGTAIFGPREYKHKEK